MRSLNGKTALITGASSGIGAGLVREYARRGASVVAVARRLDRLQSLVASGLDGNDLVVVSSLDAVTDGMKVRRAGDESTGSAVADPKDVAGGSA